MEIEVEDATTLPEWLQGHVAEGKLDLAKLPQPEDVTGLKSALQKERETAGAYAKFGKPDDIQAKIAALEEKAKGTGKGAEDAQAKLDAMAADYDSKLAAANERVEKMQRSTALASFKAELAKAGVVSEGVDMLATFGMSRVQFNDDGSPKVVTTDGKPMIGNGPDHGATLADLAAEMAKQIPHLVKDGGAGGGGKPPDSKGGTPGKKTVKRSVWDKMSALERSTHVKEGGKVVDD